MFNIICIIAFIFGLFCLIADLLVARSISKKKKSLEDLKKWCADNNCQPEKFFEIIKKYENIKK